MLPAYLARMRWFPERNAANISARVTAAVPLTNDGIDRPWLILFSAKHRGERGRYTMPVKIRWEHLDRKHYDPRALAAVRQTAREGALVDVATDRDLIAIVLRNLHNRVAFEESGLKLEYRPTVRLLEMAPRTIESVRAVQTEQTNTTALVDDTFVVKVYRKLDDGLNPEIEMGRFLTDVAGYANTPALLGSVELYGPDFHSAVAIVHTFIQNQGDAWTVSGNAIDRYIDAQRLVGATDDSSANDEKAAYLRTMALIGRRVAEMHIALASRDDYPDFKPEKVQPRDIERWTAALLARADRVCARLAETRLNDQDAFIAGQLLGMRGSLRDRLAQLMAGTGDFYNIRHHGDFHLGQILMVRDDVFIIDFEGEPRRTLAERRMRAPAARDVAGLIRSIDYSVSAARQRALKLGTDDDGRLEVALVRWRDESIATARDSYREAMTDRRLWPTERAAADKVLRFFLLEKAFYEIEYELSHRPAWLRVALAGALRVLQEGEAR